MLSELDNLPHECRLVSIDPYPRSVNEHKNWTFINEPLSADLVEKVMEWEPDLVFVDCSHVFKIGSDVSIIFDLLLPKTKQGAVIHFHDIFLPFHYPRSWVINDGRLWNEQYYLKQFLSYSSHFEVLLPLYYLHKSNALGPLFSSLGHSIKQLPFDSFPASFYIRRTRA
jgi:hypothetical protein